MIYDNCWVVWRYVASMLDGRGVVRFFICWERIMSLRQSVVLLVTFSAALSSLALAAPLDDVSAAMKKMENARYRAETTITDDKGSVIKTTIEHDGPDRTHLKMDSHETIMLPDARWMRAGDGKWMKSPANPNRPNMKGTEATMRDEMLRNAKSVRDEGMTTFNGQPVRAYQADFDMNMGGTHVTSHGKFYLNAAGRLVGSESDGEAMGKKSHTVQKITYDDSIRVQAPEGH